MDLINFRIDNFRQMMVICELKQKSSEDFICFLKDKMNAV